MMQFFTNFWFIQFIGAVALVFVCFAWNSKNRKRLLQLQAINMSLFVVQFILLRAYTGALMQFVAILRNIVFSKKGEEKWASSHGWMYFFMTLSVVGLLFSWQGLVSIFPVIGIIIGTYGLAKNKTHDIRIYILVTTLAWIPYDLIVHSYTGFIGEVVSDIGIFIGMYRLDRKKK